MGLNIYLCDKAGAHVQHEAWDAAKHAGDREFWDFASLMPRTEHERVEESPVIEPHIFWSWRECLAASDVPQKERFVLLLDILEANPGLCVDFDN